MSTKGWHGRAVIGFLSFTLASAAAHAGGGPENALLFIDPTSPDSLYVGHYYKQARQIPDRNVIYFAPVAADFTEHRARHLDVLFGALDGRDLLDHIDYVIIPPGSTFYMSAPGLVGDTCAPVNRFSASAGYTMAHIADEVAAGVSVDLRNHFYSTSNIARAFDARVRWSFGSPTSLETRPRYFIGAMLGYSGERGNTVAETVAMIDRAVASDGTRPLGVTYFMRTTDVLRSGPRDPFYQAAVDAIVALGGQAQLLDAVLPTGRHDILGIMTGAASPAIDETNMTVLPGAFCDHLTSFAATFDTASQRKLSRWIAKGAAGSFGAVEEPCNYAGKFPHARMHVYYRQGVSLGEAVFRSVLYVPFQMLLYGDPLTRPFAHLPVVHVPDAPTAPVAGIFVLTPQASTTHPTASIDHHDLYVDGRVVMSVGDGQSFTVDSTAWADGHHDVRIVTYDDTLVASQGRWLGNVVTNNTGRGVSLAVASLASPPGPAAGDLSTLFVIDVAATGGAVAEIRVISGDRVLLAAPGAEHQWTVIGQNLGAGPMAFQAVAEFVDGRLAISERVDVTIALDAMPSGDPGDLAPIAHSYIKDIPRHAPTVVELPASDLDGSTLTYTITAAPLQASLEGTGPTILLRPDVQANGKDTLTFIVSDGLSASNTATVTLRYAYVIGDLTGDRTVDLEDFAIFTLCFSGAGDPPAAACPSDVDADWDADGDVDLDDHAIFVDHLIGPR